jgi:hypothetical protein
LTVGQLILGWLVVKSSGHATINPDLLGPIQVVGSLGAIAGTLLAAGVTISQRGSEQVYWCAAVLVITLLHLAPAAFILLIAGFAGSH